MQDCVIVDVALTITQSAKRHNHTIKKTMKRLWFFFGILIFLTACKSKQYIQHLAQAETTSIKLDTTATAAADIEAIISPYRTTLEREMNISIGELDTTITKGKPNSNLGNWFADIVEASGRFIFEGQPIDFAFQNYGGLRLKTLDKGSIKVGDIYSLMPFDNTLMLMTIDRATLQQLINLMAADGGWPISKPLSYTLQNQQATDIQINNIPITERDSFHILLPDYIANGGDDCFFLKNIPRRSSHLYIRDIIIEHLTKLQTQGKTAPVDSTKRIKVMK